MSLTVTLPINHDIWVKDMVAGLDSVAAVTQDGEPDQSKSHDGEEVTPPSSESSSIAPSRASLLGLPQETRDVIYRYVLEQVPSISDPLQALRIGGKVPGILLAKRQIYKEVEALVITMRLETISRAVLGAQGAVVPKSQLQTGQGDAFVQPQEPFRALGGSRGMRSSLSKHPWSPT